MDYITFFIGFIFGAVFVIIPCIVIKKYSETVNHNALNQMQLQFENTATKILTNSSNQFSEQTTEKLDEYFKRFKEKIEDFEKRNEANFKTEEEKFTRFDENIKTFIEAGNKISQDTSGLMKVLKSDNRAQGHWGEMVLEKVLEASGLRKGEDYKLQAGINEGRPDATVFLPQEKCIYIDAKTSLSSWTKYINEQNEEEKKIFLKEFITSTKNHISGLAKRDYSADEKSPDYVLMFIPIESCYSLIFCENCDLWDFAWKNKIMPVSPSTLWAALKIINSFMLVDQQNKNAMEITALCTAMHDKFASLLEDMLKMRGNLDSALKKLEGKGNILSRIEKIEKLGIVINKEIPIECGNTEEII